MPSHGLRSASQIPLPEQRPFRTAPAQNSARSEQRRSSAMKAGRGQDLPTRSVSRTKNVGQKSPYTSSPTDHFRGLPPPRFALPNDCTEYCTWNHVQQSRKAKTLNPRSRKICFPSVCQLRKAQEFLNGPWITPFTEHHFIRSGNTPFGVRSLKK